jgi:internalin A
MPRFIVRLHDYIRNDLRWRTGAVLADDGFAAEAVVRVDYDRKAILIDVRGEGRRDYTTALVFALRAIHRGYRNLDEVERVPLPDRPTVAVSYRHLLMLERRGQTSFIPEGADREYSVEELLGTVRQKASSEEDVVRVLGSLTRVSASDRGIIQELNETILLQPNFFGLGINLNKALAKLIDIFQKRTETE